MRHLLRTSLCVLVALACASTCAGAENADAGPSPAASPLAASGCQTGTADDYISLDDVFAHDVDDSPTLRFIARLAAVPDKKQSPLFRTVASAPAAPSAGVAAGVPTCAARETAFRARRALYTVINRWDFETNDPLFTKFSTRLAAAVAALQLRDATPVADVDAILAPFDVRLADLEKPPAGTGGPCKNPNVDAETAMLFQPTYPAMATSTMTMGTIDLRVSLDREGLVRSVALLKRNVQGPRGGDLVTMSVLAAAETTYRPEIVACAAVPSMYLFRAQYAR